MHKSVSRWFFPCCFLILNAFGILQALRIQQAHLANSEGAPKIIHSPGDLERLQGKDPVSWEWDRAVVSGDRVGVVNSEAPVKLEPKVAGTFRWESEKKLTFEPMQPWPAARVINFKLQTLSTNALEQVFALHHLSRVTGPPLEVLTVEPYFNSTRKTLQLRIRLNAPVELLEFRKYVVLLNRRGDSVNAVVEETPQPDAFIISTDWNTEGEIKLLVQSGLSSIYGEGGALPRDFSFEIKESSSFSLTGVDVTQATFGQGEIELTFSDTPSLQSVMDAVRIEPEVKFSVGNGKWWRGQSCAVTGDFIPGKKYKLILSEGLSSKNGTRLTREVVREVIIPLRAPGLKFSHAGTVLNASGAKQIDLEVENEGNLTLELERVHGNNLVDYAVRASGQDNWVSKRDPTRQLGKVIWKEEIKDAGNGKLPLDLSRALEDAGQGIYLLKVTGRNSRKQIEKVIAVSDIGLLARQSGDGLQVWALNLQSAQPVAGLDLQLWSDTRQLLASGKTDEQGLCRLSGLAAAENGLPLVLLAEKKGAVGLLNLMDEQPFPGKNGSRPYLENGNEAFVYSDRGMYRPEETIYARAIVRGQGFTLPGRFPVEWRLQNKAGLTVWKKQTPLSELGTAEVSVPLKAEWPNGAYQILLSLPGEDSAVWGRSTIHLESFVPPQIVVKAETPDGELAVPDFFKLKINAQMLYGAPAALLDGQVTLTLVPEDFRSSEYPEYIFSDARKDHFSSWSKLLTQFKTDDQGNATYSLRVPADKTGPSALRAVVGVSVKGFSGREAVTFVSRRVDRVPYYVGMKAEGSTVNLLAVYPDGQVLEDNPELELSWARLTWQQGYRRDSRGRYHYYSDEVAVPEGERKLQLEKGRLQTELDLIADAVYRVAVKDPVTGFSSSQRVFMGNATEAPARADQIKLSLDKSSFIPGEEAVLSLHAPFVGRVLITVEDAAFRFAETLELNSKEETFRFMVPESGAGNLWVRATLIRPQPGGGAAPVLRSEGVVPLMLNTDQLNRPLELKVADQLRPSENAELRLRGQPGAEVVVAGVDEGILLLNDFKTPDPLQWFLALRRAGSLTWDSFDELLPELGVNVFAGKVQTGGGLGSALRKRLNPVDAKRFKPMSWWSGARLIPESGELVLQMPMPEFSGQVRWMAVQVTAEGMGHAEAFSRVGREVIVQQSLPLFLAPGDRSFWNFRLHNKSLRQQTVTLIPSAKGPIEFEGTGLIFTLEPGEVLLHKIPVSAKNEMGRADLKMGVKAGDVYWQETLELAVRPVEAFEVRAERQILAPGQELNIGKGPEMIEGTGSRSLQVVSTPVLQLTGARSYLLRYPYGCVEQTVSAASPALYLPEWSGDSKDGAAEQVQAGIHELWKKQRRDGGFGYWNGRDTLSVSGSFYALAFLLEAKTQGYDVHEAALQSGLTWCKEWLLSQHWDSGKDGSNLMMTQACRVLAMAGELDAGWVQILRERKEDLTAYGRIVAAEAMMRCGQRPLALEMLSGISKVDHGRGWHSRTSGNAELLWLLLKIDPADGRIVPLVDEILKARNARGRWANTYENASAIRALVAYEKAWPQKEDGFSAVIVRGKGPALKVEAGRPEELPAGGGFGTLINDGEGPVYVEIRSEGIPLEALPVSNTFKVDRRVMRLDGTPLKKGATVTSGETLMMRIQVSRLPRQVETLVLDQPLPAGLEPLPYAQQQKPWERMEQKVDKEVEQARHVEIRDDRVFLFPQTLGHSSNVFYVLLRAVTPGEFVFPALFAQDMYDDTLVFRGEKERLAVQP